MSFISSITIDLSTVAGCEGWDVAQERALLAEVAYLECELELEREREDSEALTAQLNAVRYPSAELTRSIITASLVSSASRAGSVPTALAPFVNGVLAGLLFLILFAFFVV